MSQHLLHPELIGKVVERLRAVADESRIRLLLRLREGEASVGALTRELGINQASVSKHLAILRQAGLIDVQRQGTSAIYRIRDESIFDMCRIVCSGVIKHLEQESAVLRFAGHSEPRPTGKRKAAES